MALLILLLLIVIFTYWLIFLSKDPIVENSRKFADSNPRNVHIAPIPQIQIYQSNSSKKSDGIPSSCVIIIPPTPGPQETERQSNEDRKISFATPHEKENKKIQRIETGYIYEKASDSSNKTPPVEVYEDIDDDALDEEELPDKSSTQDSTGKQTIFSRPSEDQGLNARRESGKGVKFDKQKGVYEYMDVDDDED